MKKLLWVTVFLAPSVSVLHAQSMWYVALDGRNTNPGTKAKPFATLHRARDEIRRVKPKDGATVYVREGTYYLTETLSLDARDSGTVYRAFGNEKVTLSGGRRVTGFVPYRGEILKADLKAQGFPEFVFRQLFFNGKRQHLARFPNHDPDRPYCGGWSYVPGKLLAWNYRVPDETVEKRRTLHLRPEDVHDWARPSEGEVMLHPKHNWWNHVVGIASADKEKAVIKLAPNRGFEWRLGRPLFGMHPGDRYYVRNLFEELDAPGEWYLDRDTWTLYFWPACRAGRGAGRPPRPTEEAVVTAPLVTTVISIKDASHITIRGFTIQCSDGSPVRLWDANRCLIAGNIVRNAVAFCKSNMAGILIHGGANNGAVGNDVYDVGSNGISLTGGDRRTLTPGGNYADNNYIHHTGVFYKEGVGIKCYGVGNRVSHNLIHDLPRMGIRWGGSDHVIEYNHIRHVNLASEDTGAIYSGNPDWTVRGTVIRYNHLHDILGFGRNRKGKWISPHYAWGIYLDVMTNGVEVYGNIIVRTPKGGAFIHGGRDNIIANNIFVEGATCQMTYSGFAPDSEWIRIAKRAFPKWSSLPAYKKYPKLKGFDIETGFEMAGNKLLRNIIYYSNPEAKLYSERGLSYEKTESDYNLIYHFGKPIRTGHQRIARETSGNLAPNPGFEEGVVGEMPKDWRWQERPNGTAKAMATDESPFGGKRALRINGAVGRHPKTGGNQYPIIVSAKVRAKPGQTYRLTAQMKAEKPGAKVKLRAQSYVAGSYFWAATSGVTLSTEWKQYELVFKMPAPGEPRHHPKMKALRARLDLPEATGALYVDDVSLKEAVAMSEWESWQALGLDHHSVIADPLFVDPKNDDYRLRPESPAFRLGFQPIPVEKIGPYRDPLRASWPIVEAQGVREKPLKIERIEK